MFNLVYGQNLIKDIGRNFFLLLKRHYSHYHNLHKLFNQNNLKISYSSLPNISSINNSYKKKILKSDSDLPKKLLLFPTMKAL